MDQLTQEQRDVLTVWKWVTDQQATEGRMGLIWPSAVALYDTGAAEIFRVSISAAAEWVRQQHPPQAKEPT
jgi:hypothetical protein